MLICTLPRQVTRASKEATGGGRATAAIYLPTEKVPERTFKEMLLEPSTCVPMYVHVHIHIHTEIHTHSCKCTHMYVLAAQRTIQQQHGFIFVTFQIPLIDSFGKSG